MHKKINIAAFLAILVIAWLSVTNYRLGTTPALRFAGKQIGFRQMTEDISSGYLSDSFVPKNLSLTLNGLFARITGRRVYNDVTKMNNGMLTHGSAARDDMTEVSEKISSLASFVQERSGTPFLFITPPYKVPLEGDLLPAGRENHKNDNFDDLLGRLEQNGVGTLDLRLYFSANQEKVEKYMYRTDHHWNNDAALESFAFVMKKLEELMGTALDKTYTDLGLWERHELKDWWIGSHGKRVGPLYAGTDSLIWYTPKFETKMSYAYYRTNKNFGFYKGDYTSIYVFDKKMAQRDWYVVNGNQVYMDKLFPLVVHRNLSAPNKQRIMMIGDSYSRGMQTFLATEFSEVHMLDPRYVSGFTIAQYAAWLKPDAVVMLTSVLHDEFIIDFGASAELAWIGTHPGRETVADGLNLTFEPDGNSDSAVMIPLELKPGEVYHLSFREVQVKEETTQCATAILYDKQDGKAVWSSVFDIAYGNANQSFVWDFAVPDEEEGKEYEILLCSGVWDEETGGDASFLDIHVEREV